MKKILFTFLTLMVFSTVVYASFPVPKTHTTNVETTQQVLEKMSSETAEGDIDWVLAAVCWLVGVLGIHRFMMGDTKNGILMLLTFGGCGIWALIDLIRILTGDLSR